MNLTIRFGVLVVVLGLLACSKSPRPLPASPAAPSPGDAASAHSPPPAQASGVELAVGAGARVVATVLGPRPALFREKDRVRVVLGSGGGDAAPVVFDLIDPATRAPLFPGGGLAFEGDAEVVPLLVLPTKAWFSVLDTTHDHEGGVRGRLVERDAAGRAKLIEQNTLWPDELRTSSSYDRAGKVAVVALGPSVYAFTRRALVLDGPGADLEKFAPHDDADCPAQKRCYPIPPKYDLTNLVGIAPDGSFVLAHGGVLSRVSTSGVRSFRYETLVACGYAGNLHVTLAHAGEPPEVVRWSPPPAPSKTPVPGPAGAWDADDLGKRTVLGRGSYEALTEDAGGNVYGIGAEGALVKVAGPDAGSVYAPEPGCRVTTALAFGEQSLAWVVSCAKPGAPPRHVVVRR